MRALRFHLLSALALGVLLAAPARAQTIAPSTLSYQGVLTDAAGVPVPDGPSTLTIRLFIAATGGSAVYAETHTVTTTGGVFAVEVGAGTPTTGTWAAVAFNQSFWLETAVGSTTLNPRTRLLAAPYARSLTPGASIGAPASGSALTAAGIIETTAGGVRFPDGTTQTTAGGGGGSLTLPFSGTSAASGYLFNLTGTGASSRGIQAIVTGVTGVRGESAATSGSGISGEATSATGTSYGGFFRSASTSGQAVRGQATATTGSAYGVYGSSSSTSGRGVYGSAPAAGGRGVMGDGGTYGGYFESDGAAGSGVYGEATSTTGSNFGGFFRSPSSNGQGVRGQATSSTGTTYGVYGQSLSLVGRGVYGTSGYIGVQGIATGASASATYGGWFETDSPVGYGVRGEATTTTGGGYGVWGRSSGTGGTGVYGSANASTGSTEGVTGTASSTAGTGVRGTVTATTGSTYGGYFRSYSSSGTGVYGWASATSGSPYGVIGRSAGTSGRGVYGEATGSTGIGVQGRAAATSGANYGGYFETASTTGRGVVGEAEATSGASYGGYFTSNSATGAGLFAINFGGGLSARIAGTSRFDNDMEFYDGADRRVIIDVDEGGDAPSIKLLRGGQTVLELDADHNGDSRVITQELEITGGSDLAEHFDVAPLADLSAPQPGMVVSIDPDHAGRLTVSATPYDRLVAGVVSGAGDVETGLLMGQRGSIADGDTPIALVGRVYVLVDADQGTVRPGDLLTTSPTPGHAMVASDRDRSAGAVIGKAMTALDAGRGLVLVLVGLQ